MPGMPGGPPTLAVNDDGTPQVHQIAPLQLHPPDLPRSLAPAPPPVPTLAALIKRFPPLANAILKIRPLPHWDYPVGSGDPGAAMQAPGYADAMRRQQQNDSATSPDGDS